MLTRSVTGLILAAPLLLGSEGCASSAFRPSAGTNQQPEMLSSAHTDRLLQLAQRYEKQGNYEGALRLYRQAEKSASANPHVAARISALAARQNRPDLSTTERQVADAAVAHASSDHQSTARPGYEFGPVASPAADLAKTIPPQNANVVRAETELPVVEPARGAVGMLAASEGAAMLPRATDSSSDGEPVWCRATRAIATAEDARSSDDWTPASWMATAHDAAPELDGALDLLHSTRSTDRKDGLAALAQLGPGAASAAPVVQSLMNDGDQLVQAYAAWTLWSITQEGFDSVPVLVDLLTSSEADVVQVSAYMLGSIGPIAAESIDTLHAVCDKADMATRLYAAEALSRITPDSAEAVQLLLSALRSPDQESRWLAAVALAGVAPPFRDDAIAALTAALNDADHDVRSVAALTLGGFGPDAQSAVAQLEVAATHEAEDVRLAAQAALDCIVR
jgi:hypothetical protein